MSGESFSNRVQTYDVPSAERERIESASVIEQEWLGELPAMRSLADLVEARKAGVAELVPDAGQGYEISPGVPEEFRALRPEARALLEAVAREWQRRCIAQGLEMKNVYLRITSLARTVEYETYLATRGYPVVEEGSHTRLMAFDILVSWLQVHAPDHFVILSDILTDLHKVKRTNLIHEPSVGVYHVGVNPKYAEV